MARMIGKTCPEGPGGRDCSCCGQAPGAARKQARRNNKRAKRQLVARQIRNELKER